MDGVNDFAALGAGLGGLPLLGNAPTGCVCPENPTGGKGQGGREIPETERLPFSAAASDLGQGWKVNPFVKVAAGETHTMMEVDGPVSFSTSGWWPIRPRGAPTSSAATGTERKPPSIETPVSDFFAVGHNKFEPVNSLAVIVNPKSAFNCYWPMSFRKTLQDHVH